MRIRREKEFNKKTKSAHALMIADSIKITVAVLLILVFLAVFALTFYFFLQLEIQYGKRKVARKALKADATNDIKMDDSAAITDSKSKTVSSENTDSMKAVTERAGGKAEEPQPVSDEPKKSINLGELKFKFEEKALIVSAEAKAGTADAGSGKRANGNEINRKPSDSKTASNVIRDGTGDGTPEKPAAEVDLKVSKGAGKSEDRDGFRAGARDSKSRRSLNLKSMKSMKSNVDYTQPAKLPENLLSKGQKLTKLGELCVDHNRSVGMRFLARLDHLCVIDLKIVFSENEMLPIR